MFNADVEVLEDLDEFSNDINGSVDSQQLPASVDSQQLPARYQELEKLKKSLSDQVARRSRDLHLKKIDYNWLAIPVDVEAIKEKKLRCTVCQTDLHLQSEKVARNHHDSENHQTRAGYLISLSKYEPTSPSYRGVTGLSSGPSLSSSRQSSLDFHGFGVPGRSVMLEVDGEASLYNPDLLFVVQTLVSKSISFNAAQALFGTDLLAALNSLAALRQSLSRRVLANAVPAVVSRMRKETLDLLARQGLQDAPYTLMFDETTSYRYGLMHIIALFAGDRHFLVDSVILDTRSATSEHLAERLRKSIGEYSLDIRNCVATSTDNGPNAAGVVAALAGERMSGVTCIAHSVQLMMKGFLMEPESSSYAVPFPAIGDLLLDIRKSFTKGSRRERAAVEQAAAPGGSALNFVMTRWNSVREALLVVVERRAALYDVFVGMREQQRMADESLTNRLCRIVTNLQSEDLAVQCRITLRLTSGMEIVTTAAQADKVDLIRIYDELKKVVTKLESLLGSRSLENFSKMVEAVVVGEDPADGDVGVPRASSLLPSSARARESPPGSRASSLASSYLPAVQRAVGRALERYERNVVPSLAPLLFRALLQPSHLCKLVVAQRFEEILLAIEEAIPIMSSRAKKKAEDHQRRIKKRASEHSDVMKNRKRKKGGKKKPSKKTPKPEVVGSAGGAAGALGAAGSCVDDDDDSEEEGEDYENEEIGVGEEENDEFISESMRVIANSIEVGVMGKRKVYFDINMIPPVPGDLFAQFGSLCGDLSESAAGKLEEEWPIYVGQSVFRYHPEFCVILNGDGTLSRPQPAAGPMIYADDVFWSSQSSRFPVLSSVAMRVRSLPVSTAEVERTFNCLSDILTDKRKGVLSEDMLEKEIFIKVSTNFNKLI